MIDVTKKPVDRQTLYEEVWADPVVLVAPRYGLSDVGLAKICRSLAIPLPSRGYWAKVKAGKIMKRPPLPKLEGRRESPTRLVRLPENEVVRRVDARKNAARLNKNTVVISIPDRAVGLHPLVKAASKRLRRRDEWPLDTKLRSAPSEVLNLSVTRASLDRALHITHFLLTALDEYLVRVEIDGLKSETVLEFKDTGVKMTFSLMEQVKRTQHEVTKAEEQARKRYFERSQWHSPVSYPIIPRYDYHPTGLFAIEVGRWPSRTWRDTPKTSLEKRLGEVVAGILILAKETYAREVEAIHRAEERRLAQERFEFRAKRRELETVRFQRLESDAKNWDRAMQLRRYADAVEQCRLSNGELDEDVRDWLLWTRAKADWLDPLIPVSDPILDAP